MTNRNGVTLRKSLEHITTAVFGLTESPPPETGAAPLTATEAPRYAGTYVHRVLVRYVVRWDGARLLVASGDEAEQPLARARGETFRTPDEQELTFVFKPGEQKARYLHRDLLTCVRKRSSAT